MIIFSRRCRSVIYVIVLIVGLVVDIMDGLVLGLIEGLIGHSSSSMTVFKRKRSKIYTKIVLIKLILESGRKEVWLARG